MYSIVLMMAMTSPADDIAIGRRGGCDGAAAASCDGGRGGFLGLRAKFAGRGAGCNGGGLGGGCQGGGFGGGCQGGGAGCQGGGGFLGLRGLFAGKRSHGCCGADACCAPASCGCCGVSMAPACCGAQVMTTTGCTGGTVIMGAPAGVAPAPAQLPATGGAPPPPVKMPEPAPKPK